MASKPTIKYGTIHHNILLISKFYGTSIGFEELHYINPNRFKKPYSVNRELLRLATLNLITFNDDNTNWKITSKGIVTVFELSKKYVKENGSAK